MQHLQKQLPKPAKVQPKLPVNQPGDSFEQEADAMADRVMRMADAPVTGIIGRSVQRKCAHCEEEEKKLMRKEQSGGSGTGISSSPLFNAGSGTPLHPGVKGKMEHAFNTDFSAVRVHTGSQATELNNAVNARAFTYGNDIYFNHGAYASDTYEGQKLLAHELTHVVQQSNTGIQRQVMRQVTNPNQIEFEESGDRYRITRTMSPETTTSRIPEPPRVSFDMDDTNVFLDISWCRSDVRGDIRFGANVPEQLQSLFRNVMDQITSGASATDIRDTILGTDITPFLSADIARSGGWQILGDVHVTVDRTGATGGGGGLTFRHGDFDLGATLEGGSGGITGMGTLTWTPGRTRETFTCPTTERIRIRYRPNYTCEQWRRRTVDRTREVAVTDSDSRYIYFNYANEVIDEARSRTELQELAARLREGYHVTGITGFTSPEGPRSRRRRSTFVGNDQLSNDRANAALTRVEEIIQMLNLEGNTISGVSPDVVPLGDSELYTLDRTTPGGATVEAEGAPLEQHAEQEFRTHSEEDRHRADAEAQLLTARTTQQRADIVYPLLRRAVITLTRDRTETQTYQVEEEGFVPIECSTIPNYDTHIGRFR